MSKKKVLFVVHQLNFGGVQKAMLSALDALDYSKYEVSLYICKSRLDLLDKVNGNVTDITVNDDKTHYYRKPYIMWLMSCCKIYSLFGNNRKAEKIKHKISEYIAEKKLQYQGEKYFSGKKKYDVAVSYIQGYPAKLVADYINADKKIMFFHGSTDETHELHESVFDKIDKIVGVNQSVQKVLQGLYPRWSDKITYLTNFVDAEDVCKKSLEQTVEVQKGKKILCSCGRLTPVKGFDLAVEAARLMKDSGEDFIWYFVGDGPERERLEALIGEYKLSDNIVITGMQSNPYPWIRACDIYVQCSYEEAQPLSVMEAMILCRPVVTTATVGGRSIVKDGFSGLIADINAESLSQTILKMIKDEGTRECILKNLKAIDYSGDFKRYQEDWESLLRG